MNRTMNYQSFLRKNLFTLRSIFYLLKPNETYYEDVENVPDLTAEAVNMFFSFIIVEQIIGYIKHNKKIRGTMSDSLTSISAGMIHAIPHFFFRKISLTTYEWVYENFKVYELPYDSVLTYLITFLFVDMAYYWFHRAAHEVNIFWAAHQVHHSSEEYNLSVALRQSVIQGYTSWVVDNVGPLELILNTPSHHRVHHGRNRYCIDKNYAGVFIIWDRLFGTFEAEKKTEEIAYGLVHPVQTFDPIYIQMFNYKYIFQRFMQSKSWGERFSVLFKGPGWVPGSGRLGNIMDIPDIESPIKKYYVHLPTSLNLYVLIHFIFSVILFTEFSIETERFPTLMLSIGCFMITFSLTCFGALFDAKSNAFFLETIRCTFLVISNQLFNEQYKMLFKSSILHLIFTWLNVLSLISILTVTLYASLLKTSTKNNSKENKIQ